MSVSFIGTKSLGAACIGIALAVPALGSALSDLISRVANLQGQIAANLTLIGTPLDPGDLATSIATAAAGAVGAIADIISSIPGPLVEANVSLGTDLLSLLATKAAIESVVSSLTAAVSAGGVHCFAIDSTPATVGSELAALVSGGISGGLPNARIRGVMLVTEDPATYTAMTGVLLTG